MITILSGPVQTGKSTQLKNLVKNTYSVGGFICTDLNGFRHLMNAHDKGIHIFEIENDASEPCINVGRFTFALSAFDIAAKWTKEQLNSESIRTIIIDEIGKLEMNDQGFHDLFVFVLNHIYNKHLIVVVRDFLLDDFIKKYALQDFEIKNTLDAL